MHPDHTDTDLLQRYCQNGDEPAFEEVVRRYAGMVLGTALRKIGNQSFAEEISQNVFTILARKAVKLAGSRGRGSVGAWLHRTTLLEACNFARSERIRVRKMQEVTLESTSLSGEENRPAIGDALDAAIDKLSRTERRLVMLRFFEGHTLGEIGAIVGKSENAVQKQLVRILDRLGRMLNRRGVAITTAALTGCLTDSLQAQAPATLPSQIAAVATAPGSFSPTAKILIATTPFKICFAMFTLVAASACSLLVYDETRIGHGFSHDYHAGSASVESQAERDELMGKARQWLRQRSFTLIESTVARGEWRFSAEEGEFYVSPGGNYGIFLKRTESGPAPKMDFRSFGTRKQVLRQQIEAYSTFRDFIVEIETHCPSYSTKDVVESLEKIMEEAQQKPTMLDRLGDTVP